MRSREARADKKDRSSGSLAEVIKPGPSVRRSAMLRRAFVECVSVEDMKDVVHGLVIAARAGSVSAARLLLKYVFEELPEEEVAEDAGATASAKGACQEMHVESVSDRGQRATAAGSSIRGEILIPPERYGGEDESFEGRSVALLRLPRGSDVEESAWMMEEIAAEEERVLAVSG